MMYAVYEISSDGNECRMMHCRTRNENKAVSTAIQLCESQDSNIPYGFEGVAEPVNNSRVHLAFDGDILETFATFGMSPMSRMGVLMYLVEPFIFEQPNPDIPVKLSDFIKEYAGRDAPLALLRISNKYSLDTLIDTKTNMDIAVEVANFMVRFNYGSVRNFCYCTYDFPSMFVVVREG